MPASSVISDVISFFVTSKCQKIQKIDKNQWKQLSHKKPGIHYLCSRYVFRKPTEGSDCTPAFLGLRIFPWACY